MATPANSAAYRLVIYNDETHSFEYVQQLLVQVLPVTREVARALTIEIDAVGRGLVAMPDLPSAQAAQERIFDGGPDPRLRVSRSSLTVGIEAVEAGGPRLISCGRVGEHGFETMGAHKLAREHEARMGVGFPPRSDLALKRFHLYMMAVAVLAFLFVGFVIASLRLLVQ